MRILITPGEPAGIGVDVTVQIAQQTWGAECVVLADPDLLLSRAKQLRLPLTLIPCDLKATPAPTPAGTLKIIAHHLPSPAQAGKLHLAHAAYVLDTLRTAAALCLTKQASALVTGPVHKQAMNEAGIPFRGHTEFFAEQARVPHTVMLFVLNKLKVALATTHLPLRDVSAAITPERLTTTLHILHEGLKQQFHIPHPRISITGLNPHAGEGGHLGMEEIDIITPTLHTLNVSNETDFCLQGPFSADTIFTPYFLEKTDAILAMYHDQALPVIKHMGFDQAVNVTLGLPFTRTSVDHGTALDKAGTGEANPGSMRAALALAIQMQLFA
ncbi:MAG TPA: 4-hydroxythreonine-4-phosphate dehydrogenase PdxA [Gammaproteobacteria bacterium]|jgi:4-hydroxythreonine-4-phosphate dehydrogenase|nr:4-hydroxythreonine-4-phosphate dehydrogenase PdxA [Gammaproteobacteria bacterium]